MAKTTVPATTGATAVATREQLPDYLQGYQGALGTETMESNDVNIPRLKLAQAMTPEVKDKLVNEGDMFHNISKQVLIAAGSTGLIIPICFSKQYILWRDRNDGGGIMARTTRVIGPEGVRHRWDKPNTKFEHKIGGKQKVVWETKNYIDEDHLDQFGSEIPGEAESGPAATAHFNYVVYMPEFHEMIAISLAKSAARKAKDLNYFMKSAANRGVPSFALQVQMGPVPDENQKGDKFFNYAFAPAGFVKDKVLFGNLERLNKELSERGINVDFSDEETKSGAPKASDEAEQF